MLIARNLVKKYDYKTIFKDVSFSIEKGQRAALVGPNGIGKTTLLKVLARIEEYNEGSIETHPGLRILYVPQTLSASGNKTVQTYICDVAQFEIEAYKIETMLHGFGMERISLNTKISDLSGGQKRKVALIATLLTPADLYLFDEPTNDLDIEALVWFEDYLVRKNKTAVIVSHDRIFLDNVTDRVFAFDLKERTITVTRGKYSNYLVDMEKKEAREKLEYTLQQEEIKRLEGLVKDKQEAAKKGAKWQPNDNDKILRGFKRNRAARSGREAQVFVRRIERIDRMDQPLEKVSLTIPLDAEQERGSADIEVIKMVTGYELFSTEPITLDVPYGTRIGFVGRNGTGKSTILKTIVGSLEPQEGEVVRGQGVRIGNVTQEHENLPSKDTPLKFIKKNTTFREHEAYNLLKKFGIDEDYVKQPIGILSSGTKTRLLLALFAAQSVNVLVLDEPTNHLDIEAIEALENLLETYEGTVILVTHDRAFLEHARLDKTYMLTKEVDGDTEKTTVKKIKSYTEYVAETEKTAKKLMRII